MNTKRDERTLEKWFGGHLLQRWVSHKRGTQNKIKSRERSVRSTILCSKYVREGFVSILRLFVCLFGVLWFDMICCSHWFHAKRKMAFNPRDIALVTSKDEETKKLNKKLWQALE